MKLIDNKTQKNLLKILIFIVIFTITIANIRISSVQANSEVDQLQNQITDLDVKLKQLNKEIKEAENAVKNASGRANTLQSNISQLEAARNKILVDIKETETEIEKAELTISKINIEIEGKEKLIDLNSMALAESIRKSNTIKSTSLIEKILGYETLSDFWNDIEKTEIVQNRLSLEVNELVDLYDDLKDKELEKKTEKEQLSKFQNELSGEKDVVEYTKQEKQTLLTRTKSEEAEYQKILSEKIRQRKEFESQLYEIESKLQSLIDPNSYQSARRGVFSWPVSKFVITQYYGNTEFARNNSQFYRNGFHNGVDFGIPIGTNLLAVADGVIKGVGNTDAFPGCSSWGKWIMVEHENGISSMNGHLSGILVKPGQKVKRGEVIGLTGNSGTSTGPHLHFTLYITQGVEIRNFRELNPRTWGCGAHNVYMPIASLDAYLNPMDYFPEL